MKKLLIIIFVVIVGVFLSLSAITVGFQVGKAAQVADYSRSFPNDNNSSQEFNSQKSAEFSDDVLEIFASNCASCHGTAGQGSTIAPALDNPDLRARLDDSEIKAIIANGRPGTAMPAWKNRLTESQINALSSLIRNWDELDTEQLSQLDSQTPFRHGMGNWQGNHPMMGGGDNSGIGHHNWRSP